MAAGGLWLLSWRHIAHHRWRTMILVVCIALAVFLPVTVQVLVERYEKDLAARAIATPMVAGAVGNRVDLTLAALYFRQAELDTIPFSEVRRLAAGGGENARGDREATLIPLHVRFTARNHPIVGTAPEYFALRALAPAQGTLPLRLGDVVLGSAVARALELGPGDALFSDPTDLYDISRPPALKMRVSGVLPATRTPDDDAVFVDVKTCWILEGLAHGHEDADQVDESMVLGKTNQQVQVSPALRSYQEVTDANIESFHFHGDESDLPLTAIVAVPRDVKAATLLSTRVNVRGGLSQMVVPTAVIDDLMRVVFRIKAIFNVTAVLLAVTTTLLLGLQILLSMRLRAREMNTLDRIGCSRHTVAGLYATEIALMVVAGVVLAGVGVAASVAALPDLVRTL